MPTKVKFLWLAFLLSGLSLTAQNVYKTPSGLKYHLASCRMVKNVSAVTSIQNALRAGLDPCKICRPPSAKISAEISASRKVAGTNVASRCRGTTKAGARCKRTTRIGNDYCFQHVR
ncbi:hypothetical protein H1R16_12120 [Marnyiella aurantia]|uniref:Uncharacterized protein n=1 Tax=Marnyiella aurantia TaxID=2758037 RepID=A0A7D7QKL9_9FLAO|nr:hypothetical protein [Marnyiella aurantia]MBA5246195.1 hypothetical protein [Marnyiella aurantia]QMS98425.1 hypothetical protein H1R16_12120 [Marnyiella aurantia]